MTLELCLRRVDFLLEIKDGRLGKFRKISDFFNRFIHRKHFLCDFLRLFPGRAVFPVRLVDVFHDVAEHISCTKITQFHRVLQYPEHGIGGEFAEIGFFIEGVDGAEPLGDAAAVAPELFCMFQKLVYFDNRHRLPLEIHALFLIAQLHRVAVVRRALEGVKELEAYHVQVLKWGKVARLFHAACKARHVEDQAIAVQRIVVLVLDVNGDAVAGHAVAAVVGQEQVGLDAAVPNLAWNEWVHELRVLDAVRTHKVQRRVDEVGSEHQVLLAGENLLDAPVIVEIDVPVLVFLDDGVNVLAVVVCRFELLEKVCEFFSCHFNPLNAGTRPYRGQGRAPSMYKTLFWDEICLKILLTCRFYR